MSWTAWPEHPDLSSVPVLPLALCGKGWPKYACMGQGQRGPSQGKGHVHGQIVREAVRSRAERDMCDGGPGGSQWGWLWGTEVVGDGDRTKMCPEKNECALACKELGLQKNTTFPHRASLPDNICQMIWDQSTKER